MKDGRLRNLRFVGFLSFFLILCYLPIFLSWKSNVPDLTTSTAARVFPVQLFSTAFLARYIIDLVLSFGVMSLSLNVGHDLVGLWMLVLLLELTLVFYSIPSLNFEMMICSSEASSILRIAALKLCVKNIRRKTTLLEYGIFPLYVGSIISIVSSFVQPYSSKSLYLTGNIFQMISQSLMTVPFMFLFVKEICDKKFNLEFFMAKLTPPFLTQFSFVLLMLCNLIISGMKFVNVVFHRNQLYFYNMPLWAHYLQNLVVIIIYALLSIECSELMRLRILNLNVSSHHIHILLQIIEQEFDCAFPL